MEIWQSISMGCCSLLLSATAGSAAEVWRQFVAGMQQTSLLDLLEAESPDARVLTYESILRGR